MFYSEAVTKHSVSDPFNHPEQAGMDLSHAKKHSSLSPEL